MAKPTASESGTKSWRPTPLMKNEGTNTASTHSMESRRAMTVRRHASSTALAREIPGSIWRMDILDLDRRFIHQDTDCERQTAQGHDVDRLARCP